MKISKNQLEQIIFEEIEENLFRSLGKKLGIGLTDVEKAKKVLEKYVLDARDPNLAMANFIRDYGTDDASDLAVSYDERYKALEGGALSPSDRMRARRAARMSVGPQSFRGPYGALEEALKKNSLDKRELVLLLNKVLQPENAPRAFVGFKISDKHQELNDEMIGKFGEYVEGEPSQERQAELEKELTKPMDQKEREMVEKIQQALANLQSNPNFQEAFQVQDLQLFDKVSKTAYVLADENEKKKLADLTDAVTNLAQYVDFEKMRDNIRSIMNESMSLTEWDLDVMILEEAIMEVHSFSMGNMLSSLNPFSSSKVERKPAPQGKVLKSKKFPEDHKYKSARTELYNIFLPIDKPRSKQFVEDLYNEKYTGMPKPAVTPPRDIRGLVEIMKKNAEATMGSDNLDLDLEGYLRNYYK